MPKGQFKRRYQLCEDCNESKVGVTLVYTVSGGKLLCIQCKEKNRIELNPEYKRLKLEIRKPLFTTKHYKAIEKLLKEINHESMTFWEVAGKFRELFIKDNPKFDEAKFAHKVSNIGSKK